MPCPAILLRAKRALAAEFSPCPIKQLRWSGCECFVNCQLTQICKLVLLQVVLAAGVSLTKTVDVQPFGQAIAACCSGTIDGVIDGVLTQVPSAITEGPHRLDAWIYREQGLQLMELSVGISFKEVIEDLLPAPVGIVGPVDSDVDGLAVMGGVERVQGS